MKIRIHRGGFAESMATAQEIEPNCYAVAHYLRQYGIPDDDTVFESYDGVDSRNGWITHMVTVDGFPVAFTDGLPAEFWP